MVFLWLSVRLMFGVPCIQKIPGAFTEISKIIDQKKTCGLLT